MYLRKGSRTPFFVCLLFLLLSVNHQPYASLLALQSEEWSRPQTIPLYDPETWPPILVADQNRTIHAFSSQSIDDGSSEVSRAIVYNRWMLEQGWTIPIDIILSPNKDARITDAFLDRDGVFHIVFWGGDNTAADIYYSEAPAAIADDARAWSVPNIIGENAGDPEGAVFVEDDQGVLYVIYNGRQQGNGLYVVNSGDGGENWSQPNPIFLTTSEEPNISELHVIRSRSGWLHAIWGVFTKSGQGRRIYYARSKTGNDWSKPVVLAEAADGLGTQTPTIIEYDGDLIALYNMTPKITMRRSADDGKTWDDSLVIFPRHVGVNGSLSLVTDGNNELHLFFGQRITGKPDIHGMWHSMLINNRWTEPNAIVKGPRITDTNGLNGFDPNEARAVVSQGNVILVTWRTDPGEIKANGVWYSYAVINTPELPLIELPQVSLVFSTTPPAPIQTATTSPPPTLKVNFSNERPLRGNSPGVTLIIGVIPVGLVILAFVIFYTLHHSRRG